MNHFIRFVKLEHTLFSLPIVFSGSFLALWLNPGLSLSWAKGFWIFLAATGARSFGFGVNRIIDGPIDAQNPRTKNREIPSGKISVRSAWIFSFISALLFIFSAGMIAPLCLKLSPIPLFLFLIYPFLKRWTFLCHFWLGFAWGAAPLGGWAAVRPKIFPAGDLTPLFLLFLFCVFWVAGFDVIYALLDEEFDRSYGTKSIPALFGRWDALRVSELCHFVGFIILGSLLYFYLNRTVSLAILILIGLLFSVSHWKVMREDLTPRVVDFAFFKVNAAIGFLVLFMIIF